MTSDALERMLDLAVSEALVSSGAPVEWLVAQGSVERGSTERAEKRIRTLARWTEAEEVFLEEALGNLSLEEIGKRLGRSAMSVKVHYTRKGVKGATRRPGWITGNQAALLLGVDARKPGRWIERGLIDGEILPFEGRTVHRMRLTALKRWMVKPTSWVYFDARKVKNESLRSLVLRAQERWGDEWLTTRQAADARGCELGEVTNAIERGRLAGFRAQWMDGRKKRFATWAFWFVRKSDALTFPIYRNGEAMRRQWTARADAFLLKARAEGMTWEGIAARMKMSVHKVENRYHRVLKKQIAAAAKSAASQ